MLYEKTQAGWERAGAMADNGADDRVEAVVARARAAQAVFAGAGQDEVDEAVTALAWSL